MAIHERVYSPMLCCLVELGGKPGSSRCISSMAPSRVLSKSVWLGRCDLYRSRGIPVALISRTRSCRSVTRHAGRVASYSIPSGFFGSLHCLWAMATKSVVGHQGGPSCRIEGLPFACTTWLTPIVRVSQEMDIYRYSLAFPELIIPVLHHLRSFAKSTKVWGSRYIPGSMSLWGRPTLGDAARASAKSLEDGASLKTEGLDGRRPRGDGCCRQTLSALASKCRGRRCL